MSFSSDLEELINKHSKENESNTPDFILAQYMVDCLAAWTRASNGREYWSGNVLTGKAAGVILKNPNEPASDKVE